MRGTRILALVLVVVALGTAGASSVATTDTTADLSADALQDGDDGITTTETDGDDNETAGPPDNAGPPHDAGPPENAGRAAVTTGMTMTTRPEAV